MRLGNVLFVVVVGGAGLYFAASSLGGGGTRPATTPAPSCPAIVINGVLDDLSRAASGWDDANQLAQNTPRIALAPIVSRMQEIRGRVNLTTVSACTLAARTTLSDYMSATIGWYLSFMRGDDSTVTDALLGDSNARLKIYRETWDSLRREAASQR